MSIKYSKIITSNSGTTVATFPYGKQLVIYDNSGIQQNNISTNNEIGGIAVNFAENILAMGIPEDSENKNIKTFQFDGTEIYNSEYISGTNLGTFVHLSDDNKLTVSSDANPNEFQLNEYTTNIELDHKATNISTISNIEYPDVSTNFAIQFTTNDVLLTDIKNKLSVDPSNVANITNTTLTNYGFTLEGQLDVSGEHNVSDVKLFYEDFSSNAFDIYSIQDLSINEFSFDISSAVTYENYLSNNITLTLNRSDLTNVDISNSLQISPPICGQIMDVSGTGYTRTISFLPTLYINEPDCSLTFHYTQTTPYLDVSMTIPFSVDTEQKIIDASLNPNGIFYPDNVSIFGVKFRLPVETPGTPDITITPSYIASIKNISAISGDMWTGTIQRNQNKNLLHNIIDFSYNGLDASLNFNVAQNPELIVGPREICNFVECNGIKITSVSLTEAFAVNEIEITDYDTNSFILDTSCSFLKSAGTADGNIIMDQNYSNVSNIPSSSNEEEKYFNITFFGTINSRKIKEITIYASHSVKIELLGEAPNFNVIANLGQVNVDISGTININEASKRSTISRAVTNITLDPANIVYPDMSFNFEMLFSTNNISLLDISNNYLSIDPSNVGNLTSLSLIENGFKLVGNIEAPALTKSLTNKLRYYESEDVSGESDPFDVYTYPSFQLLNFALTPENIVGPTDVSSNLQIEFNIPIDTNLNNSITIDPSYIVNLDNMKTEDGGYTWVGVMNRSQYMNKLENKLNFTYVDTLRDLSDNLFTASAELVFDVLESKNVLKWEKKIDTNITERFNESVEISPNGEILAQIIGSNAKIYHLQSGSIWNLEEEISGNHLSLCNNRIAIATTSSVDVYEYDSTWFQIGSSIGTTNVSNLAISSDGNRVAYIDVSSVGVYEYSGSSVWTPMTIAEPITGHSVKFSPNGLLLGVGTLDSENQNFSKVVLYEWSSGSGWDLKT